MPFSINIYLRFALIALFTIGGILLWVGFGPWYGIWFVLVGVILLAGYLLLGTVQSSAQLIQFMDFDGAKKRLGLTIWPKLLYKTNRAYFYLLHGNIALQQNDTSTAESYFQKAEHIGLNTPTEKAMIQFQLASIYANQNKWTAANRYFKKAKEYKVDEPQLKEQMNKFEEVLKQRSLMKMGGVAQKQQGGFRPGGKRKRPKLR